MTIRRFRYVAGGCRPGAAAGAGRRGVLAGLSATVGLALVPGSVHAIQSSRPKRHIEMLLGVRPGTSADQSARAFGESLAARLPGIDLTMTNVPGDAGRTMLAALGKAPANGSTVGWVITPTLPARMIDRAEPSLGQRIQLIGQIEREPVAFVSPNSDPPNTIQDIMQRASADADAVPLGTPPAGSPPHLAALRLQVLAQTQLNIVTFPSAAAARQAVLAGNVSAAALGLSEAIGDIRAGNLSAVGIAARRRFGVLPETPVLDEGGIPLSAFIRRGIAVPLGTPSDVTAMLTEAMRTIAGEDGFREQAEANGYYVTWADGPAWLEQMLTEQAALAKLWATNPWLSSSGG